MYTACLLSLPAATLIVHAFFPYGILVTVFIHHTTVLLGIWRSSLWLLYFFFISPWLKKLRCGHYNLQVIPREWAVIHVFFLVLNKREKACGLTPIVIINPSQLHFKSLRISAEHLTWNEYIHSKNWHIVSRGRREEAIVKGCRANQRRIQ